MTSASQRPADLPAHFALVGTAAALVGLLLEDVAELAETHGPKMGVRRNGRLYVNVLALYRVANGLPAKLPSRREFATLFRHAARALENGGDSDAIEHLLRELPHVRAEREILTAMASADEEAV